MASVVLTKAVDSLPLVCRMSKKMDQEKPSPVQSPLLRRLYDWTLSWAERRGGIRALFFIALLESSVFPIPPDVLLVALCVGSVAKSYKFALICTAGSVLGGMIGYAIGYWGYEAIGKPIIAFYNGKEAMQNVQSFYNEYGFWGNLLAAVTPIPYKVFTIASGAFQFSLGRFLLASIIGRSLRFFALATALYFFGDTIRSFIDKYFNLCAWLFMAVLIAGFVALKAL